MTAFHHKYSTAQMNDGQRAFRELPKDMKEKVLRVLSEMQRKRQASATDEHIINHPRYDSFIEDTQPVNAMDDAYKGYTEEWLDYYDVKAGFIR